MASKCGVSARELVCEGGEYILQFPPVEVIPRAEEAGPEDPSIGDHFGERLSDGRLSCSSKPVEPEYVSVLWVFGPSQDLIEDRLSSPGKALVMMTSLVSSGSHGI